MATTSVQSERRYDVGDAVIYPQHGAGRVRARKVMQAFGEEREYLHVQLQHHDMSVWVPVDELDEIGVRPPTPEDELEDLFQMISDHEVRVPENFSRRFKNNQRRLNDGDVWQLAEVVRNLAVRQARKHLSPSERQMYQHARDLLVCELALSMDIDESAAGERLDALLPQAPAD